MSSGQSEFELPWLPAGTEFRKPRRRRNGKREEDEANASIWTCKISKWGFVFKEGCVCVWEREIERLRRQGSSDSSWFAEGDVSRACFCLTRKLKVFRKTSYIVELLLLFLIYFFMRSYHEIAFNDIYFNAIDIFCEVFMSRKWPTIFFTFWKNQMKKIKNKNTTLTKFDKNCTTIIFFFFFFFENKKSRHTGLSRSTQSPQKEYVVARGGRPSLLPAAWFLWLLSVCVVYSLVSSCTVYLCITQILLEF
jgi:hypothetical protein